MQILAEDWAEDLAEFSPDVVERAVKLYRRESPYFPTVADIWARCDEMRRGAEARLADAQALPGQTRTREEQIALNNDWCTKILANLRGHMDARKQGRPGKTLSVQLAELHALEVEQ